MDQIVANQDLRPYVMTFFVLIALLLLVRAGIVAWVRSLIPPSGYRRYRWHIESSDALPTGEYTLIRVTERQEPFVVAGSLEFSCGEQVKFDVLWANSDGISSAPANDQELASAEFDDIIVVGPRVRDDAVSN